MPKFLTDAYRTFVNNHREQVAHDRCMRDHRFAAEHYLQVWRSLDSGGGGCPFCR
jgi:hypothetical protein